MKNKRTSNLQKIMRTMFAAFSGAMMLQSACTTEAVREQVAAGFTTAVTGIFGVATDFAVNQIFDLD